MSRPQSHKQELEDIVDKLWWGGFGTHKASLDPRNSSGLRSLEDKQKAEALQAIETYTANKAEQIVNEVINAGAVDDYGDTRGTDDLVGIDVTIRGDTIKRQRQRAKELLRTLKQNKKED